jgi:hypothetical protein
MSTPCSSNVPPILVRIYISINAALPWLGRPRYQSKLYTKCPRQAVHMSICRVSRHIMITSRYTLGWFIKWPYSPLAGLSFNPHPWGVAIRRRHWWIYIFKQPLANLRDPSLNFRCILYLITTAASATTWSSIPKPSLDRRKGKTNISLQSYVFVLGQCHTNTSTPTSIRCLITL